MSNHENLKKQSSSGNQQVSKRVWLRHTLKVVSELALGDITSAESTVHSGLNAQMPNFPSLAVENLKIHAGRPVDTFTTSQQFDLEEWRQSGKVGQSHRSTDTFAYTKLVDEKGSERIPVAMETFAFTSVSRNKVIENLGQPEEQPTKEDTESNLRQFPTPQSQEDKQAA